MRRRFSDVSVTCSINMMKPPTLSSGQHNWNLKMGEFG